jgi:hypothetical protein
MGAEIWVVRTDLAFVHLADLVDAAARRVGFVAQDAVSRAIVQTQATVDALFQKLLVENSVEFVGAFSRWRVRALGG